MAQRQGPDSPVLYAALVCERVALDEDGASILFRLVDRFDIDPGGSLPPSGAGPEPAIHLPCVLFTKWGGPPGRYTERITVVYPDREERDVGAGVDFELRGAHQFQQIRHYLRILVREPGTYLARIYLDDRPVLDVPIQVNIGPGDGGRV